MKKDMIICLLVLSVLLFSTLCDAHKVSVFAWVEGDTVYTESNFMGGKKPQGATIEVYDENDVKLLEGKTDENGIFSFKAPVKAMMKVVLVAGMGHKNEWIIQADEFSEGDENVAAPVSEPNEKELPQVSPETSEGSQVTVSDKELRKMIDAALDEKLHPLTVKINELALKNEKVSPTEMLGAIGYIIGLVGLGAYINARKK